MSNIDPRGIFRKVIKIEQTSSAVLITYECGHIGSHNPIYDYSGETQMRCFECGQIARDDRTDPHKLGFCCRYACNETCIGCGDAVNGDPVKESDNINCPQQARICKHGVWEQVCHECSAGLVTF